MSLRIAFVDRISKPIRTCERLRHRVETREPLARAEIGYFTHAAVRVYEYVIAFDISVNDLLSMLQNG